MSVLLTLAAATCLAVSVLRATLQLDGNGLARSLSPVFYLGLGLLAVAAPLNWRSPAGRTVLGVAQLLILVAALWLMPVALEGTPRFRTSYSNFGYVDPLLRGEGLHPYLLVYHNWPLFPLSVAGFIDATGLSPLTVMKLFPFVIVALYLLPLAALMRTAIPPRVSEANGDGPDLRWLVGVWLFVVVDWTDQDYFSPQAFAYLIFLCWMVLIADVVVRRDGRLDGPRALVALALFTVMVAAHLLTPLIVLGQLVALRALGSLRRSRLLVLCALIFFVWQAYVAAPFFSGRASHVRGQLFPGADFFTLNFTGHLHGSAEHAVVNQLRSLTTIVAFLLGGLAFAALRRRGSLPAAGRFAAASLLGVLAVTPISVYGGEMLIRVFLFSLPALAVAVVAALEVRAVRLAVYGLLAVMTPLHVLTHYGNELYEYVSPAEVRGFDFIAQLAPANIYGGYPAGEYRSTTLLESVDATAPPSASPPRLSDYAAPQRPKWRRPDLPIYAVITRGDDASARIFHNRSGFGRAVRRALDHNPAYRRVYANSDIAVYRWTPRNRR